MPTLDQFKMHTFHDGIPSGARRCGSPWIGMDTKPMREGLHLWIGMTNEDGLIETFNVHMSRNDARHLIEEITERLF